MERRGNGLGCIFAGLGLLLAGCLLPYLVSSVYSIVSTVLQVPTASKWLWGDWLNSVPLIGEQDALYMILAEGPICCVGTLALLIIILGVVTMLGGRGATDDADADEEDYGPDLELYQENEAGEVQGEWEAEAE